MNFAAPEALVPLEEELEDIFQDEIEDGIAACAAAQAEIWAAEAQAGASTLDADFVKAILAMGTKSCSTGKRDLRDNEAQTSHNGVFSATLRLQPRFEKNKATNYDAQVRQRTQLENQARQATSADMVALQKQQEAEEEAYMKRLAAIAATVTSTPKATPAAVVQAPQPAGDDEVQCLIIDAGSGMIKAGASLFCCSH